MPLAVVKKSATIQVAVVNPCVRPYQGVAITAMAKVSANIRVFTQIRGGLGLRTAGALMRLRWVRVIVRRRRNLSRPRAEGGTCVGFANPLREATERPSWRSEEHTSELQS